MKHTNAITRSARGEECLVRVGGYCNHNPETVVYAHKNGGGMGTKGHKTQGAYACSDCHDCVDGRQKTHYSAEMMKVMFYEGIFRTQLVLIEKGLIKA